MLGHAQRALYMIMLGSSSNHAHDERPTAQIRLILWSLATSHDTRLVHLPGGKVYWSCSRLGWICFRHGQRLHERSSSQVVFCVVSLQRKWCVVGAIGGATACTIPSCCASHACFWHEPAGFDVACSLGAMLTGHGISTFSHFESAEDKKDDRM